MLNVACVQTGNYCRRGEQYVKILRAAVKRNLSRDHRFVCLTDEPFDLKGAEFLRLGSDLGGWWNKLRLFQLLMNGPVLYLDLDTIITGPLDCFEGLETNFAALRDFWRPEVLGSGVMFWRGDHSDIYRKWKKAGKPILAGGDQEVLEQYRPHCDRLQQLLPGKIISMKPYGPGRILAEVPKGVSIVACHGQPKPHELGGWVKDFWRP